MKLSREKIKFESLSYVVLKGKIEILYETSEREDENKLLDRVW